MNSLFRFLGVLIICSGSFILKAADLRSDSLDIIHHRIHLNITDLTGKSIQGFTVLTCHPQMNGIKNINVDLLKLTVDSVVVDINQLTYKYNDTLLQIQLGKSYNSSDTFAVKIYYHGSPQMDLSNWGGFYFGASYAFNLGVGFDADPHSYGRIWFPCFDNFVERSTYTFEIITSGGKKSYCNGELISEVTLNADTIMRTWEMKEAIPSYLACVAIGLYSEVKWNYQGIQSTIPVLIAVKAADSTKLKGSFIHLNDAMTAFENAYGPYLFNKVGYSVVPFTGGAMEHASNIAYPSNAVNGNTSSELLMVHELSHHWWGDLITCERQEEMWINEGWASYSAHLFQEHVYGHDKYVEAAKANHLSVIQYAHYKEGKYWPVMGIPHEYTYGMHVYDKGASMAYNLRAYMGDVKFFAGIKSFMNDYKFKDVSSALLRDKLSQYSGLDLTDFFNDWVFGPGYTHVSIDSFTVTPTSGLYNIDLYVHQKKRGSDHFFNGVPIGVFVRDKDFKVAYEKITVSGEYGHFQIQSAINPVMISLNSDDALLMAVTADEQFISKTGTYSFANGKMDVKVNAVSDSFLLRVEHHWAAPDELKNTNVKYRLSDYRYWKVDGVFPKTLDAQATFLFDGRNVLSGGSGNLDNELTKNGSDSLILLYRKDASNDWWEYQYYNKVSFTGLNFGRFELDSLIPGEYTLANGFSAIGIKEQKRAQREFTLSPNPVSDQLRIQDASGDTSQKEVMIFTMQGRTVSSNFMKEVTTMDISKLSPGTYLVYILQNKEQIFTGKFIVEE